MVFRAWQDKALAGGFRALCFLGVAGLTALAAIAACGKVNTSNTTGPDGVDSSSFLITIELAAPSVPPGSQVGLTIMAKDKSGNPAKNNTEIMLACIDGLGHVSPEKVALLNGVASASFTAGQTEGTSTIQAKYDDRSLQTATVKIEKGVEPPPPPGGGGGSGDEIDFPISQISWDEPAGNVGAWPITARVSTASITHDRLSIVSNASDVWPHVQKEGWSKPSVGNYWVIGKCSDGIWHAATVDWAGVNKTGMATPGFDGRDDIHGPLAGWRPYRGETAYLMMSTHARSGVLDGNRQRTQIVRVTMP